MSYVVFDIETGPLPDEQLSAIVPAFDRNSIVHPGEFDRASVKVGNLKDPAKIQEKIDLAYAAHLAEVASYTDRVEAAAKAHWSDATSKAALSAITGQVVAIGYRSHKGSAFDCVTEERREADILRAFWQRYESMRQADRHLVGFNIREFDIPYIAQRSIILGLRVPPTLLVQNKWLDPMFIDLRDRWAFCGRPAGTLDQICKACGLGGKPDGVTGAMFATLYADPATRDQAMAYLENDLDMTHRLADRLIGVYYE